MTNTSMSFLTPLALITVGNGSPSGANQDSELPNRFNPLPNDLASFSDVGSA
jgi:hypothetical protein